jgi:hypothetical protein
MRSGPATFHRLRLVICGVLVLALSGGPWLTLQTVAWAGMLVKYSKTDGLLGGISKTFDGQHPCSLCTTISKAVAQSQTDRDGQPRTISFEAAWQAVLPPVVLADFSPDQHCWPRTDETVERRFRSPPVPPPRA